MDHPIAVDLACGEASPEATFDLRILEGAVAIITRNLRSSIWTKDERQGYVRDRLNRLYARIDQVKASAQRRKKLSGARAA